MTEAERFVLDNSDVVSYHLYADYESQIKVIRELRRYGRPLLNTEWLARTFGCTIDPIFPLFYLEKVGCYNWGLVAGKMQTFEPWVHVWENYDRNPDLPYDFTKWFHDIYRPSLRPYDPEEIRILKEYSAMADEDFAKGVKP